MSYDLISRKRLDRKTKYYTNSYRFIADEFYKAWIKPNKDEKGIKKISQSVYLLDEEFYRKFKKVALNFLSLLRKILEQRIIFHQFHKWKVSSKRIAKAKEGLRQLDYFEENEIPFYQFDFFKIEEIMFSAGNMRSKAVKGVNSKNGKTIRKKIEKKAKKTNKRQKKHKKIILKSKGDKK
jgi:hypothetical protein